MNTSTQKTPWLLWPFKALLDLVEGIIKLTGRLASRGYRSGPHDRGSRADRFGHHRPAGHPADRFRLSAGGARDFLKQGVKLMHG